MKASKGRHSDKMTRKEHVPSQEEINSTLFEVFEINIDDFAIKENGYVNIFYIQ